MIDEKGSEFYVLNNLSFEAPDIQRTYHSGSSGSKS